MVMLIEKLGSLQTTVLLTIGICALSEEVTRDETKKSD
jgi:hypothetical protein